MPSVHVVTTSAQSSGHHREGENGKKCPPSGAITVCLRQIDKSILPPGPSRPAFLFAWRRVGSGASRVRTKNHHLSHRYRHSLVKDRVLDTMSRIVSFISPVPLFLLLSLATLRGDPFVALRTSTTNRTLLCWAIKLSPTAYVTDAECVRSHRKHQIVMIYGDIAPHRTVQERLGRKVASLRQPACRYRVPSLVLVGAPDDSERSVLNRTVRNFIASYGMVQSEQQQATCRECRVLAIRRNLPCPVTPGTMAVVYSDCLKQVAYAFLVYRLYRK